MDKRDCPYQLDKDGYVVVKFIHLENKESARYWYQLSAVSDTLIEAVNLQSLTKENILDYELTDLLRGAYYNEYLKKCLFDYLGFRPLPLNTYIYNNSGEKVKCTLFPHQVKALMFMKERESIKSSTIYGLRGGIIKLSMGMGKSLTAIAHCLISKRPECTERYGENGFPSLIVASKTVMIEWKSQGFEKFFGDKVSVLYLHKDFLGKSMEKISRKQVVKYDFVVTTYDVCSTVCQKYGYHEESLEYGGEHSIMKGKVIGVHSRSRQQSNKPLITGPSIIYTTPWNIVILDESQRMCNPDTKTYRYMMAIYGRFKWCLTGTPIKNSSLDLWSQLCFCGYTGEENKKEWTRRCYNLMKSHKLTEAILSMDYESSGIKIPKKIDHSITVSLGETESKCYNYVQGIARNIYDKMMDGLCDFACVLALFTRLRQCSIAPYLLTTESKREKGTLSERKKDKEATSNLKEIYKGNLGAWVHEKSGTAGIYSSKITKIIQIIDQIPKSEKVLIFSMFTSVLDLMMDALEKRSPQFKFVQIDGDTKGSKREEYLDSFRNKPEIRGLLLTYKVGSEGLNLTEATHVICIEPWWTNAVHRQAESRCHRTGQTKEVNVYRIYVENSIEERVIDICKEKDEESHSLLEGTGQKINHGSGPDKYTLGRILGLRK